MKNRTLFFLACTLFFSFSLSGQAQNSGNSNLSGSNNSMHFPYPVIFIHGFVGSAESWTNLRDYTTNQGWSYGGKLAFCLNGDANDATEDITTPNSTEIKSFIPANLPAADFYAITFNTDTSGTTYSSDTATTTLSNQAAIIKGGKALGMAIQAVLNATGKDKVILFGHSMGGLTSRTYIQNPQFWQPDGQSHIAKLITTGTPHGGSNTWGGPLIDMFAGLDEQSDAVRDLRTSYSGSGAPGVYLYGGVEDTTAMDDSFWYYFHNFDVNCNGIVGDAILGLNQRPMPTDIDYTCIVSDYYLAATCTDYFATCTSGNIKTYYPSLLSETFMSDVFHTDMPSLICEDYLALDEPDSSNIAYKIDTNIIYNGYISLQAPDARYSRDYDNFKFSVNQQGAAIISIKHIPVDIFGYSVTALSGGSTVYTDSTIVGDTSFVSPALSLSAGNYNLKIWGNSIDSSWNNPYNFIVKFTPNPTPANTFSYDEVLNVKIFPNPANSYFTLETSLKAELLIHNMQGQLIKTINAKKGNTTIDISDFAGGLYFIKVKTDKGITIKKFIKE